jgi:hypothetical protein
MPFPRTVNVVGAPAVLGDFCDGSPRSTVDAGEGAFVAGPNGLAVGAFAWADPTNRFLNNTGPGAPTGYVRRNQQALITAFLGDDSLLIPPGYQVEVFNAAGMWVLNSGSTTSAIGNTAYANNANGSVNFAAAGAPTTGASCTGGTLAKIVSASTGGALPTTNTCTASIAGTVMTVTAVGAGSVLGAGQTLSGGNSTVGIIDANTTIVSQTSGTAGGIGVYQLSIANEVLSTTVAMSGGGLTLTGANTSGIFAIGMTISGTNIPAGTTITGYGTATAGGAGTYTVSNAAATAATASTITAANAMFLTVDSSSTGTWQLNDLLVSSGLTAGTYITATAAQNANLTGNGGAGTYLTNNFQTAITAQAFSVTANTATKWVASSIGAPGELVKMTTWLNG